MTLKSLLTGLQKYCVSTWGLIRHQPWGFCILLLLLIAVLLISVVAGMLQGEITTLFRSEGMKWENWRIILLLFIGTYFLVSMAWTLRQNLSFTSEQTFVACADPREVLVFFVSRQKYLTNAISRRGPVEIGGVILQREDLRVDADRLKQVTKPAFSWEMILRGIEPHSKAGTLKRIYLIGSRKGDRADDEGTHHLLPICQKFLEPYCPGIPVIAWPGESDFEVMLEVQGVLNALIKHDRETHGSSDGCICIDFTGGQKPSSAAAVLTSLNRKVTIQYVQTLEPKEAHRYDVSYRVAPDGLIKAPFTE